MLLHIVHRAGGPLERCLRYASEGSVLLLVGDGVWAALPPQAERLVARFHRCWALAEDLAARGLDAEQATGFELADDQRFVALAAEASAVQVWS